MELILKYFPELDDLQREQFRKLYDQYTEWNEKINVISRKDIQNLYIHHVLHSLSIGKWISFTNQTQVLDLGTGGGFPGIPLAILFPNIQITAIDSTQKKIFVLNEIAHFIGLKNITGIHGRVEEHKEKYHFVVSRAVASLNQLVQWSTPVIKKNQISGNPNGLICLKGGDLKEEIKEMQKSNYHEVFELKKIFSEEFFQDKKLCYIQI